MFPISDMDARGQRFPIINILFILANIAIFVYQMFLSAAPFEGSVASACLETLQELENQLTALDNFICTYAIVPSEIVQGRELFTLLTSMFLHGSILHILGNMVYLWVFGDNIERGLGSPLYIAFYLMGGIVASFTQIFVTGPSSIPNLGASGAIAAVLGAYLVWFPGRPVRTLIFLGPFITSARIAAIYLLGWWFIIQLFSGLVSLAPTQQTGGGVAFWAHIGGFVFGLIVGFILRLARVGARTRAA